MNQHRIKPWNLCQNQTFKEILAICKHCSCLNPVKDLNQWMRFWRHVPTSHTHSSTRMHGACTMQPAPAVRDMTNSMLTRLLCVGCVVADLCVGSLGEKPPRLLKYSTWGLRLNVCTGKSMVAVNILPTAKRVERAEQGRTGACAGTCPPPYRSHQVSQQINPNLHFTFTLYFYTPELRCHLPRTWSVRGRIRVVCERLQGWMRSDGMWLGMMGLLMVEERSSSRMCHKVLALSRGGALHSDVTDQDERWRAGLYDSAHICRRVNNSHLRGTLKPRVCMGKQVISILWSSSNQMLSTHRHSKIISACTQHSLTHTYKHSFLIYSH